MSLSACLDRAAEARLPRADNLPTVGHRIVIGALPDAIVPRSGDDEHEGEMELGYLIDVAPLFSDRREAGRQLAHALEAERDVATVVIGLARGGVEVAAEVARFLDAPLDVVAVRKVGHPLQPEFGIGAVTPGDGVYVRGPNGLSDEELAAVVEATKAKAVLLDRRLHAEHPGLDLAGRTALLVDDGLATGATMIAAVRWARSYGAARVVAAIPVAAIASLELIRREADAVVCAHAREQFFAVGAWYASFAQVDDETVMRLISDNRREREPVQPATARPR